MDPEAWLRQSVPLAAGPSRHSTGSRSSRPNGISAVHGRQHALYGVDRLARIATAARRPVQFVFAGRVQAGNDAGRHRLQQTFRQTLDPAFYDRNRARMPERWTTLVREALADALPHFAAQRR